MSQIWFNSTHKGTNVRVKSLRQRVSAGILRFFWSAMPVLTRKLLTRLFMSTGKYALNNDEKACLGRGRPLSIRVRDKEIHAWQWGSGPGVLMVHGWNGSGAQFHRFVDPLVEAGFSVVAMDGPGHGASSGRSTSYFEFTDVVRAFLSPVNRLGIQAVVGHSFGAAAVINALEKEGLGLPVVCIAPILRLRELLLKVFERFGVPGEIHRAIIADFEAKFGYDLEVDNPIHLLGRLKGQVLMIHDTGDRSASYADSNAQAQMHDHARLMTTRGLGHRRMLADDRVIQAALAHIEPALSHGLAHDQRRNSMNLNQAIIDQYASADEDQRLGLYLMHRGLRQDFLKIDMSRAAAVNAQAMRSGARSRFAGLRRCCPGWARS